MKPLPLFQNPAIEQANKQQKLASNPNVSVFVSASAGSGKTKLLVDRLLRLMLPRRDDKGILQKGVNPQRIQCLTYSRAGAAEMAIRLQRKLGEWVVLSDQQLDEALSQLEIVPEPAIRKAARALFAEVLDLPGGMRIETNHAFCQTILKRFPIEASIVPQFKIIEEGDNHLALRRAFEQGIAEADSDLVAQLSGQISLTDLFEVLKELQNYKRQFNKIIPLILSGEIEAIYGRLLGLRASNKQALLEQYCQNWPDEANLSNLMKEALQMKGKNIQACAENILQWLSYGTDKRVSEWQQWRFCFFTTIGEIRKIFPAKTKADETYQRIAEAFENSAQCLQAIEQQSRVLRLSQLSLNLLLVAIPILQCYQRIKHHQGVVDYNDLIAYTLDLLDNSGGGWVLYKLDGGLDHLLLDEVQDNSAEQWKIAADLSAEFFSGVGSSETHSSYPRTIFAVGDFKQSIYSFQGAEPKQFDYWRNQFQQWVSGANQSWLEPELTVSFRSSEPVLRFVDCLFAPHHHLSGLMGVAKHEKPLAHESARMEEGGRVELWPLVVDQNDSEVIDLWDAQKEFTHYQSAAQQLAEGLAKWIKSQIGKVPPYGGKPLIPGDILVLVSQRSEFVLALGRSLKMRKIPVATLVRTNMTEQLAVKDLLALCEVLLFPQDDLMLACVLKSPLGGFSEEQLMELAAQRPEGQSLWNALRIRHHENPLWDQVWQMLSVLFDRIDYIAPSALLSEVLGEHQGRAKLLSRLGLEALEITDELLLAAQQYETTHMPSMQGFLHWVRMSERFIKHEAEATSDRVRIMTVHGAKGLQGRLVILPDTTRSISEKNKGNQKEKKIIWNKDPKTGIEVPFYVPRKEFHTSLTEELRDQNRLIEEEEHNRLLYVALTRASEWLVICGWTKKDRKKRQIENENINEAIKGSWYSYCQKAVQELNIQPISFQGQWEGSLFISQKQSVLKSDEVLQNKANVTDQSQPEIILPNWMGTAPEWIATPLPEEPIVSPVLTPSRPDGVELGELPSFRSPLEAGNQKNPFYKGKLVHELLQYLPDCPFSEREQTAWQWLSKAGKNLSKDQIRRLIAKVLAVINHPQLHPLFDKESLAEQPLIGKINNIMITGQIDRMRILSDRILLCDFKSSYQIPSSPDQTPLRYLKQMAAYRALLQMVYPHHYIETLLIWTEEILIMPLPDRLLDEQLVT